ncbi:MAG: hypothetical protein P8J01_01910 [Acidimicrobiales bacterium]|nr:hypothetical protein [Acidimicrobiales bacterium]|tara:strand:- start:153 stop:392 length:240 start_codon:yes stop_codon:yes gene_type:complete
MLKMPIFPLPIALPPLLIFLIIELSGLANVPTVLYLALVFVLPYVIRSQVIRLLQKYDSAFLKKVALFLGGKFEEDGRF